MTVVRLEGVDEPSFRQPDVCGRTLVPLIGVVTGVRGIPVDIVLLSALANVVQQAHL